MRQSGLIILLFLLCATPVWAADGHVVAVFNNYRIYESDLQVGTELAAQKQQELSPVKYQQFDYTYRMEILARRIDSMLTKRILAEEGYELSETEVSAYLQQTRRLRSKMSEAELTHIRAEIMRWHFDSIIYGRYGGRAVRVPAGRIKPVEAYYALVQELMAEKVLFFPDMTYRACLKILELYFERDPHPEVHELEALKYFVQPSWGPFNERYNRLPLTEKYRIKARLKMLRGIQRRQ